MRFIQYAGRDIQPVVLCKTGLKGMLSDRFENEGVPVWAIKQGYSSFLGIRRIYKFLKEIQPHVVCDMTGNFSGIIMMISWIAGVEKRITFYRSASYDFKISTLTRIYVTIVRKMGFYFSTDILFNSIAGKKFFYPHLDDARMRVIYNGINVHVSLDNLTKESARAKIGIPAKSFVVGHMGRLNYAKNHDCILEVASRLVREDPNVYFVLAGKDVPSLYRDIPVELRKQILLLNHQNDVKSLLFSFDVFFFPSVTEGQPNALLEAMAIGLPIVASDIPSIKECTPLDFHPKLIPANDREQFYNVLRMIKEGKLSTELYALKEFATKRFDMRVRFDEFLEVLKGESFTKEHSKHEKISNEF